MTVAATAAAAAAKNYRAINAILLNRALIRTNIIIIGVVMKIEYDAARSNGDGPGVATRPLTLSKNKCFVFDSKNIYKNNKKNYK